jgi:tRNA nucleotidyltransferase (CCA-adding enzyme)
MMLILTHENADFDAVASQLAAHKLYPEGTPLLSRRTNRNVSQFLSLYWDGLPFIRPGDWQRQKIERVLLVDTQSLPSIRGLRPDRAVVQVIDHHEPSGEPTANGWSYHVEPVGATTTLLVEMMQKAGCALAPHEASLLLLGIHEDTGSLLYDTTTERDVLAAAWLVEQGAQLAVVRRFLNIPMSEGQQTLYEQLLAAAEWSTIEGQSIMVAAVTADEAFEEEISAVVHRLRDSLSPDALFVLVQLRQHVQLVARSSNDNIDVSLVARDFGGGGHNRAAAATIIDLGLDEVASRLRRQLPAAVRSTARVREIMSYGVQTLAADRTVGEAYEQMRRFGHEGYPVVDPERQELIGLLTRRAVDRAMSHKLHYLPVSQVMRAGRISVRPSDPVEVVQRLMMEEGWGQIPVIADDGAELGAPLIGIVTRTDLLNLLAAPTARHFVQVNQEQMRRRLAEGLPLVLWALVQAVSEIAD